MKLLTTIAAVLISISAFSQDLIEYDNGTFTQNGEELSMQQIDDLTVLHKTGRGNFRRANRLIRLHKNGNLRNANNILYGLGGVVTGLYGVPSALIGGIVVLFDPDFRGVGLIFLGAGTGLSVISSKAFEQVSSIEGCLRKRDKQFKKVADKINQALAAGGPLVQSSNQ